MDSQVRSDVLGSLAQAKRLAGDLNWSDAADTCRRALELVPDNIETLDKLGWYLSRAKRYDEAIEVYRDLIGRNPDKAKWPYMLGYQYYDQGGWREALKWFDLALGLWDSYLIVLYRKGCAHTQLSETDLAKQSFQKCIGIWRSLGRRGQEKAAKTYSDACFQLGKLLLSSGQTRNAEGILSEAVKHGPVDANKHYNLGKSLLRNGKATEALEQFQEADQIKPGKEYILDRIARAHMELGEYDQADAALKRIPARRRKPYVWHDLGRLRLAQGYPERAISDLLRATKLDPKNHNSQCLLGQAYAENGDIPEACRAFTRAIDLRRRNYSLEFPEAQERLTALEREAEAMGIDLSAESETATGLGGYIKVFKVARGFGFISRSNATDLFFHISDVANPDAIDVGAAVTFTVADSPKGPHAIQVSIV